jgi:ABC-type nitrate/sulfonate/bicarbonate transport system substrate-binding protein
MQLLPNVDEWMLLGLTMVKRHATPYHAPVYLAQKLGYFADEGIKVALLEPNDPSGTPQNSQ